MLDANFEALRLFASSSLYLRDVEQKQGADKRGRRCKPAMRAPESS
jgi:hypothetical protein